MYYIYIYIYILHMLYIYTYMYMLRVDVLERVPSEVAVAQLTPDAEVLSCKALYKKIWELIFGSC